MDVVRAYVLLPHLAPIVVVIAATAGFAIIASAGLPDLSRAALLLGAVLGGQIAIGAANELIDVPLDRVARPDKPIPAGLVSERSARILAIVGLVAMLALGLPLGVQALLLCALGTGVGVAYSIWFKGTIWSWAPYFIALPLLPIFVWTALGVPNPALLFLYAIAAPAVIAVNLAQSLPDVDTDRAAGVRSLAVALGPDVARWASWGATLVAGALAAMLAPWLTERPTLVWFATLVTTVLVAGNVVIWIRSPQAGTRSAFAFIAPATAALALAWTAALPPP